MERCYQKFDERELVYAEPLSISLPDGRLNPESIGWSRQPVQVSNLRGYPLRKKRWNYWCVTTPDFLFSITLSNVDYMGLAFAYFLDFNTKEFIEQTTMSPFGMGCILPETVEGKVEFHHREMDLEFLDLISEVDIQVKSSNFGGKPMCARLKLTRPDDLESLNIMIPWSDTRYHFTSKQNCLHAGGTVSIDGRTYTANAGRDFACLDFGRGMWKYRSFWNWSSFSTRVGNIPVGVNLGAGWTNGSGTCENSLLINNRLEKISEEVIFDYDPAEFMKPWRLRTAFSNQVDLTFTPFYERVAKSDVLVVRSEVHQMIGSFSGTLTSQDGLTIPISNAIGWAEEHNARW